MKHYLPTALALACVVLITALFMTKRGGDEQHGKDAAAIADFSNQLWSAQTQIAINNGKIVTLSNNFHEAESAVSTFSNQLTEAQSSTALATEQITNLNQRVVDLESENEALSRNLARSVMDLTNQVTVLTNQLVAVRAELDRAGKNYELLENRLRRDVAGRLVMERQFNNLSALKAQIQNLERNPVAEISADSIYAGLDVEVKSNSFYVIAPN
ncbi:MAG TPA: hypothetical protein VFY06_11305 [Verrucomicrobiae bacterium]|nr:hypothetical protein [Verrucomicrobiae bacterium]